MSTWGLDSAAVKIPSKRLKRKVPKGASVRSNNEKSHLSISRSKAARGHKRLSVQTRTLLIQSEYIPRSPLGN